ncbi:MAG: Coenzyme F420 hydrogenase/dehydrogenase, beta subunit C-terminal domain [Desulfobulbus sp.]|nr:Coenzyme F420 hydrogenase/dehydrogenase, beta subunit C-terminal domain [Desulfobulbus sp.]
MESYVLSALTLHTLDKECASCTGCAACAAICPMDAITMKSDDEGFLQPNIQSDSCTDCGLCREVCPVNRSKINKSSSDIKERNDQFPSVWATWHLDEDIRRQSSSGGVFTALAENVLGKGGVVVGAAFDDQLIVRHCIIESVADLHRLRGSKYVQSEISPTLYHEVRHLLKQGQTVLFSGTPCQVAGLRCQLKTTYEKLLCCDIVCHGVPSPLLFTRYVQARSKRDERLSNVVFRDKTTGWKKFSICWTFNNGSSMSCSISSDPYMLAFLRDVALRLSCYNCKFTNINRQGDITLADFWGVAKKYPEYDMDDKGTSLVLVNSPKGQIWLDGCRPRLFLGLADIDTAIAGNPVLVRPVKRPPERDTFYHDLDALAFKALVRKYQLGKLSFHRRVIKFLKRCLKL